ncbi:hypothetical protein DID75_05350, partial [Candidatus Marinamargulisbacteria bacterium SCGC AG-410-N11]
MQNNSKKRFLIARCDVLGDVVLSTALIPAIKDHYPNSEIYFLANKNYKGFLNKIPEIKQVIECNLPYSISFKHINQIFSLAKEIKKLKIDIFLNLWENPWYSFLSFLVFSPIRLNFKTSIWNILFASKTIPVNQKDFHTHQVTTNLSILKGININNTKKYEPYLKSIKTSSTILKNNSLQKNNYIVINLGAACSKRALELKDITIIINYILQYHKKFQVVLTANSPINITSIDQHKHPNIINLVNKLTILDLITISKYSKLIISADTGLAHIACAFKIPTIINFFTRIQNPLKWSPYNSPTTIIWSSHNCIDICSPNTCPKITCKENINLDKYKEAINKYLHPSFEYISQKNQKFKDGLKILLIGNNK